MTKPFFDILLIVPLEEELLEVQKVFPEKEDFSSETTYRYEAQVGNSGLRMLVVQQEEMGRNSARDAVEASFDEFDFGFVIGLGIAGSLSSDLSLCDVCYSENVYDFYDNTKAQESEEGDLEIKFSPNHTKCYAPVVAAMNFIRTVPALQVLHADWQLKREELAKQMFTAEIVGRDGKPETIGQPKSKQCKVACAAVSKSPKYNSNIRGTDRKILAIETEIGGVLAALNRRKIHALTIRGISDYADHAKDQLEDTTGGKIRSLAAGNAATFLRLQFDNPRFVSAISKLRSDEIVETQAESLLSSPVQQDVTTLIAECTKRIDEKLRELAPEFKLLEKGYRLPVPRMRNVQHVSGMGARYASDPEEVREALERHQGILLGLAKNYPDASLPWVIASDLLTAVIGEKQMIPIVVDGDSIKPPRLGLSQASYWDFAGAEDHAGAQVVFIIDAAPLSSKTRIEFLIREIKSRPGCRFIIITRDESQIISESELAAQIKAEHYQLTNVSFHEIAHFVEKNFDMTAPEAEVIAMRLNDTFSSFDLSAHPTYFAGLSKGLLATLLQANRRAELIQLAVDGFLLLVVAADKASVKLSRTTRERFLRILVTEIKVEKRTLTLNAAIDIAADIANEHGYEIDPANFVTSFIDGGILHLAGERILFSLPFVESYLLAVELAAIPEKALRYFDLNDEFIDLSTFDIYCELNPSTDVIDKVLQGVMRSRDSLALEDGEKHILLTDAARPAMISKAERLKHIEERFNKLSDDVKSGRGGDVKRKQKLLDMADRMRETASDRSGLVEDQNEEEMSEEFRKLNDAIRCWATGTQMLGSAAEHLKANTKELLASLLIQTSALKRNLDVPVETAGSHERGVKLVRVVAGTHHDHAFASLRAVDAFEQRGDDFRAVLGVVVAELLPVANRVDLVDENDRGGVLAGLVECCAHCLQEVTQMPRRLPAAERSEDEMNPAGARQSARERGLASPGRSGQQNAAIDVFPADGPGFPIREVGRQLAPPIACLAEAVEVVERWPGEVLGLRCHGPLHQLDCLHHRPAPSEGRSDDIQRYCGNELGLFPRDREAKAELRPRDDMARQDGSDLPDRVGGEMEALRHTRGVLREQDNTPLDGDRLGKALVVQLFPIGGPGQDFGTVMAAMENRRAVRCETGTAFEDIHGGSFGKHKADDDGLLALELWDRTACPHDRAVGHEARERLVKLAPEVPRVFESDIIQDFITDHFDTSSRATPGSRRSNGNRKRLKEGAVRRRRPRI